MQSPDVYIESDELPEELYELKIPSNAVHVVTAVYSYGPMSERRDDFKISVSKDDVNWVLWRLDNECETDYRVCATLPRSDNDQNAAAAEMLESFWDTRSCNYDGEGPWDEAWGSECLSDDIAIEIYERIWGSYSSE